MWNGVDWVSPTAAKQRDVLAVLLCNPGEVVTPSRLMDELWGHHPPPTAGKLLHGYISRLRRLLTERRRGALSTRSGGYVIAPEPDELDAQRFTRMVGSGRKALHGGAFETAADFLRAALDLWRGRALEDVDGGGSIQTERTRLTGMRSSAIEDRNEAELACGRHRALLPELESLVAEHPMRERLTAQLMVALYRCGRQVDALAAFRDLRRRLVEEMAIEPGPELQQLEQSLLRGDLPTPASVSPNATLLPSRRSAPIRRRLPPDVAGFTGRQREIARIRSLLEPARADGGTAIVAVHGSAGVGKSALMNHVARQVAHWFSGGVVFADLRGSTDDPAAPDDVAGALPDAAREPAGSEGHRVLVVLDDARSATQIAGLLPTGAGCGALISSRRMLATLHCATQVQLRPFAPQDSVSMLGKLIDERFGADPEAAETIARACGHLPLALRIAATKLAARPDWALGDLARSLSDEHRRLDMLRIGELSLRSFFQASVRHLSEQSPQAVRLLRVLGALNAPDVDVRAAAAMSGTDLPTVTEALDRLAEAHLVDELSPGRYRLPDLSRLFAVEWARQVPDTVRHSHRSVC